MPAGWFSGWFSGGGLAVSVDQHAGHGADQVQNLARVAIDTIDVIAGAVIGLVRIKPVAPRMADQDVIAPDPVADAVFAGLTGGQAAVLFLGKARRATGRVGQCRGGRGEAEAEGRGDDGGKSCVVAHGGLL